MLLVMMGHCYTVAVMWIQGSVFFLNDTFLSRTSEKQVDVLEHKKVA